jgi:RNA polymerase sigma-70 factor (ECF subfamily)
MVDGAIYQSADDVTLMRWSGQGRTEALEELYRRYADRLFGFGLRLLGDRAMAEELVQETLLRMWRSAGSFDPARGSVAGYLFTTARHVATDLWRRPSSRPFVEFDDTYSAEARAGLVPDPADRTVATVMVRRALDLLSPAHRVILELAYLGDLTQAEIASILDVPLGTVKTRTYHALRALKVTLSERGNDD